jgi:hypothetical protein
MAPSTASSLPTCGPTNSLRCSVSGSAAPAAQTCLLIDSPLSLTPWRDCSAAFGPAQRVEDAADQFALLDAFAQRQPDQHVACAAEVLHLGVADVHALDRGAHLADVGRLGVSHLDHGAAGELDRQVQPARQQEEHRRQEGEQRDDVEHQRMPHERDVAPDAKELHG